MIARCMRWVPSGLVVALTGWLLIGSHTEAQDNSNSLDLEKIPTAVIDVLKRRFPEVAIEKCTTQKQGDFVVYELEFKHDGRVVKSEIAEDGKFHRWSNTVEAKALPKAGIMAMERRYPKSSLQKISKVAKVADGKDAGESYEVVLLAADKKERQLVLSLYGRIQTDSGVLPRESQREFAWFFNYPGGMLFHTAFHEGYTTRFLLLKTALHANQLSRHLDLDEQQRLHIKNLQPVKLELEKRRDAPDANAQPDEQVIDPEYFAFLRPEQLKRLDAIAIRFDGYSALSRKSVIKHLNLGDASQTQIANAIIEIRETIIMPRFRWEFAGRLPEDIQFRNCHFAGSICTHLNLKIFDILTDGECQRLFEFMSTAYDADVADAVEKLAPLPHGIGTLIKWAKQED